MNTIYKYKVEPFKPTMLPVGAQIINAAVQNSIPYVWAIVNPTAALEPRNLRTIATGESFDNTHLQYIGTFHGVDGWMVFHLFEVVR